MHTKVHHPATVVKYPDWVLMVYWSSGDETLPASSKLVRLHALARAKEIKMKSENISLRSYKLLQTTLVDQN
jgi:hypothetical protein